MIWLAAAFAQSDDPEPAVSEEVIVYGELKVIQAREKVIDELSDLGYDQMIEKDGAIVMRHSDAWKGEVWLHDDGWMRVKRQPVQYKIPKGGWGAATCVLLPFACVKVGGQTVGKRKFMAVETRVVGSIDPDVREWGDRMADLAVERKQDELPTRLERLWRDGVPLDAEPDEPFTPLATVVERKAAILEYWETRTDNPWGERVRSTVEAFIRGEVQSSDDPFTDEEIIAFNRQSRAGRKLDLERRRVVVEDP